MQEVIAELRPYLVFLVPPLVGAFIGFLTNKVAIRMLFRPLKAWHIFGVRVPMTPGVIPSKRREFAENMGQMVGGHLLTSEEIGTALKKEKFQSHLLHLIESKVGAFLQKDSGPVSSLIPAKFRTYFDVAVTTVKYQIKERVFEYVHSEKFEGIVRQEVNKSMDSFLDKKIDTVLTGQDREVTYKFLESRVEQMLHGETMEVWIDQFVRQKVYGTLKQSKSTAEILPETVQSLILEVIEGQTPALLQKLGEMTVEPDIRDKIVIGVKEGVENFIASLGPMAGMVNNFLTMETVELKVREYLIEKEDDIVAALQNEDIQQKVAKALRDRCVSFLNIPIVEILPKDQEEKVEAFCDHLKKQLIAILREKETTDALLSMVKSNIESHLLEGDATIKEVLTSFLGEKRVGDSREWVAVEAVQVFRKKDTLKAIESMMNNMIDELLAKPIGQISKLIPAGVRDGIYLSLQKMASDMLATEVPGLVDSLNIRNIVTEKIDSLDLLRLEKLLLSIMEEQFKYINLFGGLLGFILGCFNLLVIYGM